MKTIHRGLTKSGQQLIIRYPQAQDLLQIWHYFNKISAEKTFITYQGEKISKKHESKWLDDILKDIRQKKCVYLLVFVNGKLSGVSNITLKERVSHHVGSFGITLSSDIRGQGIGKLLMDLIIAEAQKKLPGLKIVTLECYANNQIALNLYRSLGFVEHGRLPAGLHRLDSYVDEVMMHKVIK